MNRFKILKGVDPFANKPSGDSCKYKFMGVNYRGWRIDENSLIIELDENAVKFFSTLKEAEIEIYHMIDGSKETFQIKKRITNTPYKESKRPGKVNVHLVGETKEIITPVSMKFILEGTK